MIDLDPFSILVTVFYVGALYLFLTKFFFGPVERAMEARRSAIEGRLVEARKRIEEIEEKTSKYEAAIREARTLVRSQQENSREDAAEERARLISAAKEEAEALIGEATAKLGAESETTKKRLESEVDSLADRLTETLLQDQGR